MILLRHGFPDLNQGSHLLLGLIDTICLKIHLSLYSVILCKSAQKVPVATVNVQNRTILLGVLKGIQQSCQLVHGIITFDHTHISAEVLQLITIDGIALLDGIHMRLDVFFQDHAVVLSGFHKHGKVRQLISSVIDIKSIYIVFQDASGCISLGISIFPIDLHQHIKQIYKDMATALAGIDTKDILRCQALTFRTDLYQLRLHFRFLLCLRQVIFPLKIIRDFLLAPAVSICQEMLHPQPAKAILHHVSDNPVRREQLRHCRDLFFCNLSFLCKSSCLRLGVIVLVQPADDLHLATFINIEIALRDRIHEHPNHTVTGVRQFEEKFHIIVGLFKKAGQDIIQLVAGLNKQQTEGIIIAVLFLGLLYCFQLSVCQV